MACNRKSEKIVFKMSQVKVGTLTDHTLRCCVSRVLTANGLVNGNPPFSTPTKSTSLNRSQKIVTDDYVHDVYSCAKFGENPTMSGFWANRRNKTQKLYLHVYFLWNSPTGQTAQEIFTVDSSNDADSHKGTLFGFR